MKLVEPKKIFIVDDDIMLSEALSDYLSRNANHDISVFNTGEEFVRHLNEKPDVVILDYYLNTVNKNAANGLEILESIQNHLQETKVIMLSSQDSYANAAKTIQKGALQYVVKGEDAFQQIVDSI